MFRFVLLLSPFVAKVSEPLVPSDEWCGGPHLHETFVSFQPRATAATGSLLCRGRHFRSRQPQSCRGEFSGPPVVIMAGFKLRAWIVVREHRTTRAAPLVPGHAPR
ncbi:hypothetical protein NDU88_012173 [Pleurodeles waltl]|uniref:Secreted protein n=1 Tax=Pleurodeles waltl TaxID=8319 RepID=A0AAV7R0W7_PLEWA|nr:hypothetical protein NDU88_012173 [Pleurodeles waltl]